MNTQTQDFYRTVRSADERVYTSLRGFDLTLGEMSIVDKVDLAYALREALALIDDIKRRINGMYDKVQSIAAFQHIADNTGSVTIATEYTSTEVEAQQFCTVPRANSAEHPEEREQYEKLMTFLGIDPMLWDNGEQLFHEGLLPTKVVDIYWPGFQALCMKLTAQGLPLPDGVNPNKTYTKWRLKIRKKKDILAPIENK